MNKQTQPNIFLKLFQNWNNFEIVLFVVNVLVATTFLIYGYIRPGFIHKNNQTAYILNSISFVANLTNVLSILISTQKRISQFWFGGCAAITLGIVAFLNGATGSWIMYWVVQLPLQFVGYYFWKKNSINKIHIKPRDIKMTHFLIWIVVMLGLIALWTWIDSIHSFQKIWYGEVLIKQSWVVFVCDAGLLVIGISGAIMMILRHRQQWILWIILDILCIVFWSLMLNVQMIIMASTALLNGCYGIYAWYKK
jgi:nicotinamide mononucleotide transporter